MSEQTETALGCALVIGVVVILITHCCTANNSNNTTPTVQSPQQTQQEGMSQDQKQTDNQETQQERQKRLDKINSIIDDAHKSGLIIEIKKADFYEGNAYIVVDENMWNQLPYETKQQLCRMALDYSDLTGVKILAFRGYRTGKDILPNEYSVHNF